MAGHYYYAKSISYASCMAEREGFEPPIGLHLCRISSAVHSTTLPPLQTPWRLIPQPRSGRVLGEDGWPDKARNQHFRAPRGERKGATKWSISGFRPTAPRS